jgi:hypothetical protein
VASNPSREVITFSIRSARPGLVADGEWKLVVPAEKEASLNITLTVNRDIVAGRHVVPFVVEDATGTDSSDTFAVLEVE